MPILVGFGAILAAIFLFTRKVEGAAPEIQRTVWPGVEPSAPTKSIDQMVAAAASQYGVSAALVKAVAMVESSLNPNAQNPSDPSYGLMQIMPILAEDFGIVKDWHNPTAAEIAMIRDPQTNLRIGAWYLKRLTSKYEFDVAVQMYNVGEAGYKAGRRNENYLSKVKRYYNEFRNDSIG